MDANLNLLLLDQIVQKTANTLSEWLIDKNLSVKYADGHYVK